MRCRKVVCDKRITSGISEGKQYEKTMANEQSEKGRGEYQINEIIYAKRGCC